MNFAQDILDRGIELALAVTRETTLENGRHTVKLAAIERIMKAGDNIMTGKPHSFSSAEAAVTLDSQYAQYLEDLAQAQHERIIARARYDAALAAARLGAEVAAT